MTDDNEQDIDQLIDRIDHTRLYQALDRVLPPNGDKSKLNSTLPG